MGLDDTDKDAGGTGGGEAASVLPKIDCAERAGHHTGRPQVLSSRLFMQLLVLDCVGGQQPQRLIADLGERLRKAALPSVLYEDVSDPRGIGVLSWSEDPAHFLTRVRPLLGEFGLERAVPRTEFAMLGRTYATGYEPNLRFWLLERPVETVLNPDWPWAVWYPLRRSGAFARLAPMEQAAILKEHALIGRAYGAQDLAHDIRLACHGLDARDNEFVIGLVGQDLHPLSHVVESMRKTRQTSEYISQMGPFFVGRAAIRLPGRT